MLSNTRVARATLASPRGNQCVRKIPAALFVVLLVCALALCPHAGKGESVNRALGLPEVVTEESGASVELGHRLFFDERLSADGKVSCATCHDPAHAMADGRPVSLGHGGAAGSRNSPSVLNTRFSESFFWDGRRATLEEQALDPFVNPVEHGLANTAELLGRIRRDESYGRAFSRAFGVDRQSLEARHVADALAAFQRTMVAGDTPFDRYYYKAETSALSESAVRGLKLFQGAAQCASCHTVGEKHALFTDQKFHRLSVGMSRIEEKLADLTRTFVVQRKTGETVDRLVLANSDFAELGRFAVTLNPVDIGKFRTPSLRNVALTAPYMHDGSVRTLEEAIDLEVYYRGTARGYPLILTLQERDDLVAFMHALTSPHAGRWTRPER